MSMEEQAKRQEEMQDHSQNLTQAAQMQQGLGEQRQYLEAITENGLDEASVHMLENMVSADFILSNLNDAEIHEIKHLRRITKRKVFAAHPSPNSIMQGEVREQVYNNGQTAEPLDQKQKSLIEQFIRGAFTRLARSRDGFQQEEIGKSLSVSERRTDDDGDGGLLNF